jgi:hypothetical protein
MCAESLCVVMKRLEKYGAYHHDRRCTGKLENQAKGQWSHEVEISRSI